MIIAFTGRIFVVAISLFLGTYASQLDAQPSDNSNVMGTRTFEPERLTTSIRFTARNDGNVRGLSFRSAGFLESLRVDSGDRVARGQILASLDTTQIDDDIAIANERLKRSELKLDRGEALRASGVIGDDDLEELQHRTSLARLQLDALGTRREWLLLRAPSDGTITSRLYDFPTAIKREAAIFQFISTDDVTRLLGSVSQIDAESLSIGQPALITAVGRIEQVSGTVTKIQSRGNTGFLEVEVSVNEDSLIDPQRLGLLFDVTVSIEEDLEAYLVPPELIRFDRGRDGAPYIVVSDNTSQRLFVDVIEVSESGVHITAADIDGEIEILLKDF